MFQITLLFILATLLPISVSAEPYGAIAGYQQLRFDSSRIVSETGIGGSCQVNDYLDVRGIGSLILDGKDNEVRLNLGLADLHTPNQFTGARIGRIQHSLGFYTEQLNWAPARDLHLSPQGIYRENFRYMLRSGDGIQLYQIWRPTQDIILDIEATFTKPILFPMDDITVVWNGIGGTVSNDSWVRGLHAGIEILPWKTKLRYDQQQLNYHIENTVSKMFDGDVNTRGHYLGGRTEITDSTYIIYEYLQVEKFGSTWDKFNQVASMSGVNYSTKDNSIGYGLSMGWQINDSFKLIGGHSAFYVNPKDKYGEVASKLNHQPTYTNFMEDDFIALKYRRNDWISTIEVHNTRGTTTMTAQDQKSKGEYNTRLIYTITKMF